MKAPQKDTKKIVKIEMSEELYRALEKKANEDDRTIPKQVLHLIKKNCPTEEEEETIEEIVEEKPKEKYMPEVYPQRPTRDECKTMTTEELKDVLGRDAMDERSARKKENG